MRTLAFIALLLTASHAHAAEERYVAPVICGETWISFYAQGSDVTVTVRRDRLIDLISFRRKGNSKGTLSVSDPRKEVDSIVYFLSEQHAVDMRECLVGSKAFAAAYDRLRGRERVLRALEKAKEEKSK